MAALTSESAASWSFPARLLLAQSYCALGTGRAGRQDGRRTAHPFRPACRAVRPAAADRRVVAGRRRGKRQRAQSYWRWTPRDWPRNPGSGRSRCWRCTTRSASATESCLDRLVEVCRTAPVADWRRVMAAHASGGDATATPTQICAAAQAVRADRCAAVGGGRAPRRPPPRYRGRRRPPTHAGGCSWHRATVLPPTAEGSARPRVGSRRAVRCR